jgi:hypothetical protein
MNHGFVPHRFVLGGLLIVAFGCDGTSAPAPPEMSNTLVSSNKPDQTNAKVDLIFNASPRVTSMSSSVGRVDSNAPIALQAIASDTDGDALSFVWTGSCPGAFDRTDLAQVTFTAGTLPVETATCSFEVDVSDGRGGAAKGMLSLSAAQPKIDIAPAIGIAAQSTDLAAAEEVVFLHATASDPEGEAITWTWTASDGTLLDQADQAGTSDVRWKAPARPGARCTITVTATDPEGGSSSFEFEVRISG